MADEPEAPDFDQIIELRKAIQELVEKVDLLAFSKDGIFFNQKKIGETGGYAHRVCPKHSSEKTVYLNHRFFGNWQSQENVL